MVTDVQLVLCLMLQMMKKRGHVGAVNPAAKRVCRENAASTGLMKGHQRSIFNFLDH